MPVNTAPPQTSLMLPLRLHNNINTKRTAGMVTIALYGVGTAELPHHIAATARVTADIKAGKVRLNKMKTNA